MAAAIAAAAGFAASVWSGRVFAVCAQYPLLDSTTDWLMHPLAIGLGFLFGLLMLPFMPQMGLMVPAIGAVAVLACWALAALKLFSSRNPKLIAAVGFVVFTALVAAGSTYAFCSSLSA